MMRPPLVTLDALVAARHVVAQLVKIDCCHERFYSRCVDGYRVGARGDVIEGRRGDALDAVAQLEEREVGGLEELITVVGGCPSVITPGAMTVDTGCGEGEEEQSRNHA